MSICALLASGVFVLMLAGGGEAKRSSEPANGVPASRDAFPETRSEGDKVVMPVAFPDGTTAEVVYRADIALDQFVVSPWIAVRMDSCCTRVPRMRHSADAETREEFGLDDPPVKTFEGSNGNPVTLRRTPSGDPSRFNLVFKFGRWLVAVRTDQGAEQMNDEQLQTWARALAARPERSGFIVLEARKPLQLHRIGEPEGPQLTFSRGGQGTPRIVSLIPGTLAGDPKLRTRAPGFASMQFPDEPMRLHVQGDDAFLDAVLDGLGVRNVRRSS